MENSPLTVVIIMPTKLGRSLEEWVLVDWEHSFRSEETGPLTEAIVEGLSIHRHKSILRLPEKESIFQQLIHIAVCKRRMIENCKRKTKLVGMWRRLEECARRNLYLTKLHPLQRLAMEASVDGSRSRI